MKQYEQVIRVMENNSGYATLGYLYQNVNVKDWKTKTPFASIRRIVQDSRFFFKIRPGLWALEDYREKVLGKFNLTTNDKNQENLFNHTYYQAKVSPFLEFFEPSQRIFSHPRHKSQAVGM